MENRMVKITSMVNNTVTVRKPEYGVNRTWKTRGQTFGIPFDTVRELMWDTGFKNLIYSGILYIPDLQDKIDLGIEDADATEAKNIIAFDEKKMTELLTETPMQEFVKLMTTVPRTQVDNLIIYAIEKEIVNTEKCRFLKALTGKDILIGISRKHQMED